MKYSKIKKKYPDSFEFKISNESILELNNSNESILEFNEICESNLVFKN